METSRSPSGARMRRVLPPGAAGSTHDVEAATGSLRWKNRPPGANWGAFGDNDQQGRLNLISAERRRGAAAEVREGIAFCLSLPLDRPGGNTFNRGRPPAFHPVMRDGHVYFNLAMECVDPSRTDVGSDEAVLLHAQHSTHWEGLAYRGALFDADGDGAPERVFYNGHRIVDPATGQGRQGALGATALSVDRMAETCVQGRGVLIDLHHHCGDARVAVGYDRLRRIMDADRIVVEEGDMLCLRTGLGSLVMLANGSPDPRSATPAPCSTETIPSCCDGSRTAASPPSRPTISASRALPPPTPRFSPRACAPPAPPSRSTSIACSSSASRSESSGPSPSSGPGSASTGAAASCSPPRRSACRAPAARP